MFSRPLDETTTDSGVSDVSPEPSSIFERPGFGSVVFPCSKKVSETLMGMASENLGHSGRSQSPEGSMGSVSSDDEAQEMLQYGTCNFAATKNYWAIDL